MTSHSLNALQIFLFFQENSIMAATKGYSDKILFRNQNLRKMYWSYSNFERWLTCTNYPVVLIRLYWSIQIHHCVTFMNEKDSNWLILEKKGKISQTIFSLTDFHELHNFLADQKTCGLFKFSTWFVALKINLFYFWYYKFLLYFFLIRNLFHFFRFQSKYRFPIKISKI